ncbi:MAG TPA: glucan biosynthesis protein [Stellaceae bacterium]|nr:glucan biosynthesis protein [Stellaceae bacterium]
MRPIGRRNFLTSGLGWTLALSGMPVQRARADAGPIQFGPAQPFDFTALTQRAAKLAKHAYVAAKPRAPKVVDTINFDQGQKIKFRPEYTLWRDGPRRFPVRFFHLDKFVALPVRISAIADGAAREILYSPRFFDYDRTGLQSKLPVDLGFSGFRVMAGKDSATDWLAFQGASYFRSSGAENQYGASARGIAVDTALSTKEEFPRFVEFWLDEPPDGDPRITIYALLDGPSLTGAYRFDARKGRGATIDVRAELFMRNDITRLGIAPLTSMYWYGQNAQCHPDWRPQIHDSDGLALSTGAGEHVWRPLIDPPSVLTNSFFDDNPKGFGLMQRDRAFADYQDDGAFYNRRPGIWVEPAAGWGAGAVQLIEIPTNDEIHDNVVAYWLPKRPIKAGDRLPLAYRLYWQDEEPHPPTDLARVVATRIGRGGVPGKPEPTDKDARKFVIDFMGGPLAAMKARYDLKPTVVVSRGTVDNSYVIKVVGTSLWRAFFDVHFTGKDPLDLRCVLRLGGKPLTETWIYEYLPPT